MASREKSFIDAVKCTNKAGRYAFGLNEAKAVAALRQLADDLEAGVATLHSMTTSSHITQDEFACRELTIEVLDEAPHEDPQIMRG